MVEGVVDGGLEETVDVGREFERWPQVLGTTKTRGNKVRGQHFGGTGFGLANHCRGPSQCV